MLDFILVALRSNRVKAAIFGFVLAFFTQYFPDYVPDESTLNWLYGIIVAFIAGDTIRPIDPDKPSALSKRY